MYNLQERILTTVCWGLILITGVRINKSKYSNFGDREFYIAFLGLILLLVIIIVKNRYKLQLSKPNWISLIVGQIINYMIISSLNANLDIILIIVAVFNLILLNISFFLKIYK